MDRMDRHGGRGQRRRIRSGDRRLLGIRCRATPRLVHGEHESRRDIEIELDRILTLPVRDQLALYQQVGDRLSTLGEELVPPDERYARMAASLDQMQHALDHHRIDEGRAPRINEFDTAAAATGSPWRSGQVVRLWGSWSAAQRAFAQRGAGESSRQIAGRKGRTTRTRRHETPLTSLRLWHGTNPAVESRAAYDLWGDRYNASRGPGQRPVLSAHAIRQESALPFEDLLDVAARRCTIGERRAQRIEQNVAAASGCYVSIETIALMLDRSRSQAGDDARSEDFPKPIATVSGVRVWRYDVVRASSPISPSMSCRLTAMRSSWAPPRSPPNLASSPAASSRRFPAA
jgi:hypothetical protein